MADWFSCKGACSGSDPVSDTVKVDFSNLAGGYGKENQRPLCAQEEAERKHRMSKAEEVQKSQEEKQCAQDEFRRHQQQEADEQARRSRQAEELAKRRREEEECERRREVQAAAERVAAERVAAEEAAAAAAESARAREEELRLMAERATEEKARLERVAEQAAHAQVLVKVSCWCKANGFADMNCKKKSFMGGSRYPLHEAVSKKNEEIVGLLVCSGVDKDLKNSKGQTAEDLAVKMNKGGSMDGIIAKMR